ncbi:hypothetical protein [Noviherbaspirillum soli]|uniref:hypothetical protein n=1 Tax=Noviherbaspirillum soli TaxID=1064518 RepID=UPI00188C8A94|nr:hypothetical protein [Noviherbaspirillum soli]
MRKKIAGKDARQRLPLFQGRTIVIQGNAGLVHCEVCGCGLAGMVEYIGFGRIFNDMTGCVLCQGAAPPRHRQKRKRGLASSQPPFNPWC